MTNQAALNAAVESEPDKGRPGLHRFALLTAAATFVLLVAGALVTSKDAGDSVPDWPLAFGQVVPWPQLVGNVLFEYGHRVIAATVGLLTIGLNVLLWQREARRWVRVVGLIALGAVVVQGALGGARVLLLEYRFPVAMIHAFMAQLFFGLTVGLAVLTSPGWLSGSDLKSQTSDWKGFSIRHWCAASTAAIYVQLILGAAFRHRGIGIIPHVVGAIVVTVLVAWTAFSVFRHYAQVASLKRPAALAGGSLAIQMILGVAAYLARVASYDDPQPLQPMVGLTVAHLAGGAAVLAAMLVLTLRAFQTLKTQDSRPKTQDGSEDRRSRIEDRNRSLSILDPPSSTLDFRRGSWVLGLRSYLELTKPRITLLILLTAVAGFWMGSKSPLDLVGLLHTAVGIGLLSAGIATLNQYLERKLDGLMMRTASRPLPSQRLTPAKALWFGATMAVGAELYLAFLVNPLTAVLGLIALGSYLFVYTPLKTRTTLCTAIGAIPGAMPPLMGWTAARGELGIEAWILFSILFLWQFPHFLSIAWLYRDDYARAGIRMLPVVEREGKVTGEQIVAYSFMLLPVSLLPALLGLSGPVYLFGALALGLVFLYVSIRAAVALRHSFKAGYRDARRLLLASVVYLPLLFGLMVIGK